MNPCFCPLCGAPFEVLRGESETFVCSATGVTLPPAAADMIRQNLFSEPPFASALDRMLYDAPWFCARCGARHAAEPRGGAASVDLRCASCERQCAQGTALMIVQLYRPEHDARVKGAKGAKSAQRDVEQLVALYLEGGASKLARAVRAGKVDGAVALDLLAELDGPSVLDACLALARTPALAARALRAIAAIVQRDAVARDAALERRIRRFVHAFLDGRRAPSERARAWAVLAVAGDAASLTRLKKSPRLRDPYRRDRDAAIQRLEARLAERRAGTSNARASAGARHGTTEKEDRDHRQRQRRAGARARTQARRS